MAQLTEKHEFLSIGGLVMLIGLLLILAFPIGTIIGVFLMMWGGNMVKIYRCAECGNKVESKNVLVCSVCKENLIVG